MEKLLMILVVLFLISSINAQTVTDKRDRQTYKTVRIGEQVLMAENLNYKTDDSWCFDNDPTNCEKYGRLYTWEAAMKGCPVGWHLPTDDEWTWLTNHLGGRDVAGDKMKATIGWNEEGNGTNESGFSGLPGGDSNYDDNFHGFGYNGYWWSATESDGPSSWYRYLHYSVANMGRHSLNKGFGFSVRCIQD